jgi:hypothetical protein
MAFDELSAEEFRFARRSARRGHRDQDELMISSSTPPPRHWSFAPVLPNLDPTPVMVKPSPLDTCRTIGAAVSIRRQVCRKNMLIISMMMMGSRLPDRTPLTAATIGAAARILLILRASSAHGVGAGGGGIVMATVCSPRCAACSLLAAASPPGPPPATWCSSS